MSMLTLAFSSWHCSGWVQPHRAPIVAVILSLSQLSVSSVPQVLDHIAIGWAVAHIRTACDALQDVFQKSPRSYVTVSGLRRCHVLIKIQIPCIDCVIRLVQPGPAVLILPVIYDHLREKSFCVIIWGNRAWVSVILLDLFCIVVLVVED